MKKVRLDALLTDKGLFESRAKAQRAIMAGEVLVNEQKIDKPGTGVDPDSTLRLLGSKLKYVSRGGLKLEKALEIFPLQLQGKVMADLGASTGGFTDCALQNGAAKVYALDVGYGQLAWQLRNDARVVNMERTNVRFLEQDSLPEQMDVVTIDVAFISLTLVLPAARKILKDGGVLVALIKPQFEAGRDKIGKHGVVKDAAVHLTVIHKVVECARSLGFQAAGLDFSPIKGPEGNIEYLLYLTTTGTDTLTEAGMAELVQASHGELD